MFQLSGVHYRLRVSGSRLRVPRRNNEAVAVGSKNPGLELGIVALPYFGLGCRVYHILYHKIQTARYLMQKKGLRSEV